VAGGLKKSASTPAFSQRELAERVGAEYYTFISSWRPAEAAFPRTAIRCGRKRCAWTRAISFGNSCDFMIR